MSGCQRVNCSDWERLYNQPLVANDDITGPGVVIGFLGTGYLTFVVLLAHYLVSYDPEAYSFDTNDTFVSGTGKPTWWKPNPIDVMVLHWIRRLARRLAPGAMLISRPRRFENAFNRAIVSMCDIQLFNGLGILISGFISMKCGLQAYHWQIVVYLAWFSSVTHLSGLMVLRQYLSRRPTETYVRYSLMMVLVTCLIAAIIPTGYFNWAAVETHMDHWSGSECSTSFFDDSILITAANTSSPAKCFFNIRLGNTIFDGIANRTSSKNCTDFWQFPVIRVQPLGDTAAFQSMIVSIVLLVFGFISRSIRLFRTTSMALDTKVRQPLSILAQRCLVKLKGDSSQISTERQRYRRALVINPLLAIFLTFRLNFDLFSSMLAELYWLLVLLLWGTLKLYSARSDISMANANIQWTFGQMLSALLLIAPVWSMAVGFANDKKTQLPIYESLSLHGPRQDGFNTASLEDEPASNVYADMEHRTLAYDFNTRDYYQTAPWFVCCTFMACSTILYQTTFQFFSVLTGEQTLLEYWITESGVLFFFLLAYSGSHQATILYGLWMDHWLYRSPERIRRRHYAFWGVALLVWGQYATVFSLLFPYYVTIGLYVALTAALNLLYLCQKCVRLGRERS